MSPPTIFLSQNLSATTIMSSRHRPLLTCGVSILAIADIAFRKIQDLNGPFGSTCQRIAKFGKFASPLIYAIRYQWLAILSFFDDQFLAMEKMIENFCPSSSHVFDKIEEIVLMIGSLPEKFDYTVNKFPAIMYQFPIMEWALAHLISCLNCLISTLNHWGLENSRMKEITIDIATNCTEQHGSESDSLHTINNELEESFASVSEYFQAENYQEVEKIFKHINDGGAREREKQWPSEKIYGSEHEGEERDSTETVKVSESVAKLEDIGRSGIMQEDDRGACKGETEWQSEKVYGSECEGEEKDKDKESEGTVKFEENGRKIMQDDDSILHLFESKWLMKPVT